MLCVNYLRRSGRRHSSLAVHERLLNRLLSTSSDGGGAAAADVKSTREQFANRLHGFDSPSVWTEFGPLAVQHDAINLGQGFPNFTTPSFVREAACDAITNSGPLMNQYTRSAGHLPLVKQLADSYSSSLHRELDYLTEVVVGAGASEVLYSAIFGIMNPDDEAVLFDPAFDIYRSQIQMAGGKTFAVPMYVVEEGTRNAHWTFDIEALERLMTSKTRILLLNTPHNPTGMVFSKQQLEDIRDVLQKYPKCIVISDEVYEHQLYDGYQHVSPASIPGMFDRTLTVSSAGKMFSCTGWKVGWAVGPKHLVQATAMAHQWITFCVATPFQEAIARSLKIAKEPYENFPSYYAWLASLYSDKRNILASVLKDANMAPIMPNGGFFIMANTKNLSPPQHYLEQGHTRDWSLARWLTIDVGVSPIPTSPFYDRANAYLGENYLRFAICKSDADLKKCGERLNSLLVK